MKELAHDDYLSAAIRSLMWTGSLSRSTAIVAPPAGDVPTIVVIERKAVEPRVSTRMKQ
jgi:hypothetical protein